MSTGRVHQSNTDTSLWRAGKTEDYQEAFKPRLPDDMVLNNEWVLAWKHRGEGKQFWYNNTLFGNMLGRFFDDPDYWEYFYFFNSESDHKKAAVRELELDSTLQNYVELKFPSMRSLKVFPSVYKGDVNGNGRYDNHYVAVQLVHSLLSRKPLSGYHYRQPLRKSMKSVAKSVLFGTIDDPLLSAILSDTTASELDALSVNQDEIQVMTTTNNGGYSSQDCLTLAKLLVASQQASLQASQRLLGTETNKDEALVNWKNRVKTANLNGNEALNALTIPIHHYASPLDYAVSQHTFMYNDTIYRFSKQEPSGVEGADVPKVTYKAGEDVIVVEPRGLVEARTKAMETVIELASYFGQGDAEYIEDFRTSVGACGSYKELRLLLSQYPQGIMDSLFKWSQEGDEVFVEPKEKGRIQRILTGRHVLITFLKNIAKGAMTALRDKYNSDSDGTFRVLVEGLEGENVDALKQVLLSEGNLEFLDARKFYSVSQSLLPGEGAITEDKKALWGYLQPVAELYRIIKYDEVLINERHKMVYNDHDGVVKEGLYQRDPHELMEFIEYLQLNQTKTTDTENLMIKNNAKREASRQWKKCADYTESYQDWRDEQNWIRSQEQKNG